MINLRAQVENINEQISEEVENIIQRYRNEADVARTQQTVLEASLESLKEEVSGMNRDAVQLRSLEREAEAQRALHETFLNRFQETSVQEDLQQVDAEVIAYAEIPGGPSYPPKNRFFMLAFLLSFGAAGACAFVVDRLLDRGITTLEDVEELLGIQGLIGLPFLSDTETNPVDDVVENPMSIYAEALRSLHTSIELSAIDDDPRIIMFTSSIPGEGKTTISTSYARLMSLAGRKVLLIDADLRRGQIHRLFNFSSTPGIVELLLDKLPWESVIHHDSLTGLDIIPAGKRVISPQDILGSMTMNEFLNEAKIKYDLVILDTPPANVVSEARHLALAADRVVMVIKWNTTDRQTVKRGVSQLERIGAKFAGAVISQVDVKKQASYGYGYSRYSYNYDAYNDDEKD